MWGSVLGLALLVAVNPVLLGLILLMISRPRPEQNLLAYWVGCLMVWLPGLLVPLMVLHSTPTFKSFAQDLATPTAAGSSTSRHIQIGIGVLALSVVALMTVRSRTRRRQLATPAGHTSTLLLDSNTPTAFSRTPDRAQGAPTVGGSAFRLLRGRAQNAWENGSLWIAFLIGVGGLPPPFLVLFVDTTIVASGAAIGTQVSAVIVFVVGMFVFVEITFVSHLVAPAKTQAVLRPLHGWAQAHRRKILIAIFTVVGVLQLADGMGII
jgi:Sap, sulfolipid-1-addressing protein